MQRQPIIVVLGHVDHGKTSLLDWIRGTTLAEREAGKITQHIGATEIPLKTIKKTCGNILKLFNMDFNLPGLLFIDTPGHEAFSNLRRRGGSIADLAVLIVDINQGVQPQTEEAINILKNQKVPFVVAANKVDVIPGWKNHDKLFLKNLEKQIPSTKEVFENRFYSLMGQVSEGGFQIDLYNKISDFTKSVAVVPISAKTGEGVPELLALLAGLSQKFLKGKLEIAKDEPARGTILEIKEEKGMGTTADVIIYAGTLTKDDYIAVGGSDSVITTKIRSLLKPDSLSEIRDKKSKFKHIDKITAASGVKILALNLDKALSGAPLVAAKTKEQLEVAKQEIIQDIESVLIKTENDGLILKADTLGSLEAAIDLLKKHKLPIKRAGIGNITKRDIVEASSNLNKNPLHSFVLGFHVKASDQIMKDAKGAKVNVICRDVIYKMLEDYEKTIEKQQKETESEKVARLVMPAKIKILSQYIFRQSGPAIFGAYVISGKLKPNLPLMDISGRKVGVIKTIEDNGKRLGELPKNHQAAISVSGLTLGRQAKGGDELYVNISEAQFKNLKENKKLLNAEDIELLKEIAEIKRRGKTTWGL